MAMFIVLNDGETFMPLEGSKIIYVPDSEVSGLDDDEIVSRPSVGEFHDDKGIDVSLTLSGGLNSRFAIY